jgi:serine/threonine-protein kinase
VTTDLREQLQATLGDTYTFEHELGGAGMSRVFLAEEARLGRRVVVKVLPSELTEGMSAERFAREVRLAARLQHPNIVPLLTAGEREGLAYYTMPFVDGESLREHLARVGRMPVDGAVSVLRDVARALEYAHAHGVVHRDIKPGNILVAGSAAAVTDFGIAKALHAARAVEGAASATDTLTRAGTSVGTPAYMAPEQAAGDPDVDARADVYAWGVVAYELLAGTPPFAGPSAHHLVAAHIGESPQPLGDRAPDVPAAVSALVMRCLEKAPSKRPQSGSELLGALEATRALSCERPLTGKRGTRRRVVATAGVLAFLAAAITAVMTNHRASSSASARPVLAVLPFQNVSAPSDAYFAEGLTEEVRTRLTKISGLQVIGGRSTGQYTGSKRSPSEIARALHATHLLMGSVRWERVSAGARVRVNLELVRGADQAGVWAEPVEGPLDDIFALQSRIADKVADALNVALVGSERRATAPVTRNVAAYQAYLRGVAYGASANRFSPEARRAYTAAMKEAIALDPQFAAAHARLADAYLREITFGYDSGGLLDLTRASVERAMALDTTLVESQLANGSYREQIRDLDGALWAYRAAERLAPNDPEVLMSLGSLLEELGRSEEAISFYQRIEALEPRWADGPGQISGAYRRLGRYDESVRAGERLLALSPTAGYWDLLQAGTHLLWKGDTVTARRVIMTGPTRPAIDELVRLPSPFIGRAIWLSVFPPAVLRAKDTITLAGYTRGDWGTPDLYHLMTARHFALTGRKARARAHADSVIALLEPALRRGPGTAVFLGMFTPRASIAEAYAYMGRSADAARAIDEYVADQRRDPSKSAFGLPLALVTAAYVDVLIGRRDAAVARLKEALPLQQQWISRALLRADPSWAPLHGHAGFERLIGGS